MGREIPHRLGEDYVEFVADFIQSYFPRGIQYWNLLASSYRSDITISGDNGDEMSFDLRFGVRLKSVSTDPRELYVEAKGTYDQTKVDFYFRQFLENLINIKQFIRKNTIKHGSKGKRKSYVRFGFISPLLPSRLDVRDLTHSRGIIKIFSDCWIYLFNLDYIFKSDIAKKIVSEDLKKAFEDNGYDLTNQTTIDFIKTKEWKIVDNEKTYFVKEFNNGFRIYQKNNLTIDPDLAELLAGNIFAMNLPYEIGSLFGMEV